MELNTAEKQICKKYSAFFDGTARCKECPLCINWDKNLCYATIRPNDPRKNLLPHYSVENAAKYYKPKQ